MFLRQIRQNGIPEIFLLPQGVEAAVQVHFVCRCKDRAAEKQLFICGIHGKVADLLVQPNTNGRQFSISSQK